MEEVIEIRKTLATWKGFLFHQKYRFDLGYHLLALMNFVLLIIAASDKLRYYTQIPRTWILVSVVVPIGFISVWLLGLFLDKVVRYGQAANLESAKRNPLWINHNLQMDRIEEKLNQILALKGS